MSPKATATASPSLSMRFAADGTGPEGGQLLAVDHVTRGAREATAEFLLVGRMDVVAVADIDGHGEAAARVFVHHFTLHLAQFRPTAFGSGWVDAAP